MQRIARGDEIRAYGDVDRVGSGGQFVGRVQRARDITQCREVRRQRVAFERRAVLEEVRAIRPRS